MELQTNLPRRAIDLIEFISADDGESGWFIYLKDGWSFDPMSDDKARFIPLDAQSEAQSLSAYLGHFATQ